MPASEIHPIRIAEITTGPNCGKIGITFAPEKRQLDAMSGLWGRDLATNLDAIADWNAAAVMTLLEDHELRALNIPDLSHEVRRRHMEWHHLPRADVSIPSALFESTWPDNSRQIQTLLGKGWNVLIHCKGGLGRAGMIAAHVLVQLGSDPTRAIDMVRAARGQVPSKPLHRSGGSEWDGPGRMSPARPPQIWRPVDYKSKLARHGR
jgi:ADP-ribosyl-[dinitrogen reductase] hydrolase